MKTEAEVREELAPKIADLLVARCRAGLPRPEAEILAHDLIARIQAACLLAQAQLP